MDLSVNELMIGNFFHDKLTGELLAVSGLAEKEIGYTVIDRDKFPLPDGWSAEPIPLTKQWLWNFGFIGVVSQSKRINDDIELSLSVGGNIVKCELICETLYDDTTERTITHIPIKYVHQLQNLYFALTNKELKYESK